MKGIKLFLVITTFAACLVFGQANQSLKFEVASLLPDPPGKPTAGRSGCRGIDNTNITSVPLGRCVFSGIKMARLMAVAFPPVEHLITQDNVTDGTSQLIFDDVSARGRIMPQEQWINGAPKWFDSETFTINAKAEVPEKTTQGQLRLMLQTLMKERFKLAYHYEPKTVSAYYLARAAGGIKLKEVPFRTATNLAEMRRLRESGANPFPMQVGSLIQLAIYLGGRFKTPVIDTVNSVGPDRVPIWYDFSPLNGVGAEDLATEEGLSALLSMLPERAGLKLESHKIEVKIFAIDHVEQPAQ